MLLATKRRFSEEYSLEGLKERCKLGVEVNIAFQLVF